MELLCGPLAMNVTRREVAVNGEWVHLTRGEFDVLRALMEKPNGTLNKLALARALGIASAHSVEVHLSNIRKALKDAGLEVPLTEAVPPAGVRLSRALLGSGA